MRLQFFSGWLVSFPSSFFFFLQKSVLYGIIIWCAPFPIKKKNHAWKLSGKLNLVVKTQRQGAVRMDQIEYTQKSQGGTTGIVGTGAGDFLASFQARNVSASMSSKRCQHNWQERPGDG